MPVSLPHAEELSLEEVSEGLGVRLATSKRYLAAAREALGDTFDAATAHHRSS
jgi:DNA-directed RNA polymerase specialized sigma24 family protein